MDITGEYRIPLARTTVWNALNDPDILGECIPGCENIERVSDTHFKAKVVAKVGPVKAGFDTEVTLSDLNPPASYTLTGEGKGGAAGFARGSAEAEGNSALPGAEVQVSGGGGHYVIDVIAEAFEGKRMLAQQTQEKDEEDASIVSGPGVQVYEGDDKSSFNFNDELNMQDKDTAQQTCVKCNKSVTNCIKTTNKKGQVLVYCHDCMLG